MFTGFDDFKLLTQEHNFDVICLSETWLHEEVDSVVFSLPGYRFFRQDRLGRGGGVAAYVKNSYTPEFFNFDFNISELLEHLVFKIKINKKYFAFGVFYRPPNTNFNNFVNDFDNILSYVGPIVDETVILGDFNINLLYLDNPLITCFETYGLVQIIDEPTRISSNAATLLDPIFVTDNKIVNNYGTISADIISDHRLVFCELNVHKARVSSKFVRFRSYQNFNFNTRPP